MKRGGAHSQRMLFAATIAMLVVALALLAHLLRRFEGDIQANVRGLQRVLATEALLRDPSDPYVRFGPLEELVSKYAEHPYLREMTITKYFRNREVVVYPFYYPAVRELPEAQQRLVARRNPWPDKLGSDVLRVPLQARGRLLGNLYVRIDRTALQSFQLAIGLFTLLLVGFVGLYVSEFRRQQAEISRTTIELEEKRRELMRLERLALAGQLSASLLHDLKKPVLNIKNELSDLLAVSAHLPQEVRNTLSLLVSQAQLFFGMLRETNLERFVRGEGELEYADVNELIKTSLALVRYERGQIEQELHLGENLSPVLVQPVQLVQVFSNIILNAYQAMEGHGKLTIRSAQEGCRIWVEFRDTGPGISQEDLDKIFAPFFSTKTSDKGTGLGLYISRDIVRNLGGDIRVTSDDSGTTFVVELPVNQDDQES
ncbi:MAG: sensor histidine kinase [Candidatus Sumerlaeaceae bacterium]